MIILYANGITEELKAKYLAFTDHELIDILDDFNNIRTHRLSEVPNTWCMWGENKPIDKNVDEYNQLASTFIGKEVYSPMFFIHDTEIDPDWKLTDDIIQNGYNKFKKQLLKFFDNVAMHILTEQEKVRKENGNTDENLIVLDHTGISEDKRIIYNFDLVKQKKELLEPRNFLEFSIKIYDFLKQYYKDGQIFVIYADKNILIKLEDEHVKPLIDKVINSLQSEERYEMCSDIKTIYNKWSTYKNKSAKILGTKQRRKSKSNLKDDEKNTAEQK